MTKSTGTWILVGGLVLAGVAAAVIEGGSDRAPAPPSSPPAAAVVPEAPPPQGRIEGKVAEVIPVDSYTYFRLEDGTWAAVTKTDLAVGDEVSLASATLMRDFESKTLGRTFDTIYFGTLAGGSPGSAAPPAPAPAASAVKVPRAEGGVTVVELYEQAEKLEGTKVTFAGQVVKVTPGVLGKTWVHLQDGTGDAAAKTHDVVVTTQSQPEVGDTLTITGTLARDVDLGAGYRYDVLVEDAEIKLAL